MPELPEVETTRRGIKPHILHKKVTRVRVRQKMLRWPVPDSLVKQLPGQRINSVRRRGKYLLLGTSIGTLLIHLGMSGSLRVLSEASAPQKHDHVDIELDDGKILRFTDPRRFGSLLWHQGDIETHPLLRSLGPEPLTPEFSGGYLFKLSRKRSAAVKTYIMDSHVVVGVGNIYANEALFSAGINPRRAAGRISLQRYTTLVACIKQVLQGAIEVGGTTLRDFTGSDGEPGYFKQSLLVYGRGGLPCTRCGQTLKEIRLGQRSTVYCSHCQK